jgi:class 3 adenylate cyclase
MPRRWGRLRRMKRPPTSVLGVLVFTDIVGSTAVADELGDRRWRALLARHHAIARRELRRFGGREIDTAGDGFFVMFNRPAEAIRWADAVGRGVRDLGIEIRAGVHAGEAESFGDKVSGVTVHIGARVLSASGAGEILCTSTVKEMVPGSGIGFVDHGVHQLKGVPGEWRLFRVSTIDGRPREPSLADDEARQRRDRIQAPAVPRRARLALLVGIATVAVVAIGLVLLTRGGNGKSQAQPSASATTGQPPVNQFLIQIDADTARVGAAVSLPGHPTAIAWGAGSVWVTLGPEGTVLRLDPADGKTLRSFTVDQGALGIAVDDESAWVVGSSGILSRIDVRTGTVEPIEVGGNLEAVAIGDRDIWVSTNEGQVSRIDAVSRHVLASTRLENIEHDIRRVGLAAAPDGVWVNSSGSGGTEVNSIAWHILPGATVDGGLVMLGGTGGANGPAGVALDGDRLWAVDYPANDLVLLDPTKRKLTSEYVDTLGRGVFGVKQTISVGFGGRPGYVVLDDAGDPWVLNLFGHSVVRVSSVDFTLGVPVLLDRNPVAIAYGAGTVWVAISRP